MLTTALFVVLSSTPPTALDPAEAARARLLVETMRRDPRGPYAGVLWFCADGTSQPPKPGACAERGGGRQHGVLSKDALALVDLGVPVGTVLAGLEVETLLADGLYRARALVVERYLERALGGWVSARAGSYRGARQAEDEEAAAIRLLQGLVADRARDPAQRNLLLRLIRALPYGGADERRDEIRGLASQIGDLDRTFDPVRAKIHSLPEPSDRARVAEYRARAPASTRALVDRLLDAMAAQDDPKRRAEAAEWVRARIGDRAVRAALDELARSREPPQTIPAARAALEALEATLGGGERPRVASRDLILLYGMTLAEARLVDAAARLKATPLTRGQILDHLTDLAASARVLGLLSSREHAAALEILAELRAGRASDAATATARLGRVLEWGRARHLADFGRPLARYRGAEPAAYGVIDDLLRGGVLAPTAVLVDRLAADADRRAGGHVIVGVDRAGVRGENPGLAVGTLRILPPGAEPSGLTKDEIVLVYELGPDLPPVAGLLTVGPAGSLSHVSLLAQNLGLPHVALGTDAASHVERWAGRRVAVGVSASRRVILGPVEALPDPIASALGRPTTANAAPTFRVDPDRLALGDPKVRPVAELTPADAGRRVGPKAAELARLERLFPDRISDAAVIPFGAFFAHVSRPAEGGSPFAQLVTAYSAARDVAPEARDGFVLAALARFRAAIETLPFPEGFEAEVGAALDGLGEDGAFGVFVRSDTNVEDLDTFTGAGLNLTVPNVVGKEAVLRAIRAVWTSPFTERAYRWRQSLLENPEHVYPSVLLHRTVPSEVSGVLVTTDVETGDPNALTVSVSEGVAAVVDGGAPETVVVPAEGAPRLLSSSRVFAKKTIPAPPRSGVTVTLATGADPLLDARALAEVSGLARQILRELGRPTSGAAWDIEFGLLAGRAWLFQIRPLKANRVVTRHPTLQALDAPAVGADDRRLSLDEVLP